MPKQKITKEMVVNAAFELAREGGMNHVLVKNIAERLGCSVQPIYSYCANMGSLKKEVIKKITAYFNEYIEAHVDKDDLFASTGKLYLRLCKEEPNLFQMYFFASREDLNVHSLEEMYQSECNPRVADSIVEQFRISEEKAKQLQLNMVIFNQGLMAINLACGLQIPIEEMEEKLVQVFFAFLNQTKEEEE